MPSQCDAIGTGPMRQQISQAIKKTAEAAFLIDAK
jgi:hypothetical protein